MAKAHFDPMRAVEIRAPFHGTGYRIGGHLVLTARHLLKQGIQCECMLFSTDGSSATTAADIAWISPTADIALIKLPPSEQPASPVSLGTLRPDSGDPIITFDMYGWPQWANTNWRGQSPASAGRHIRGTIYLHDRSPDGLLVIEPDRLPDGIQSNYGSSAWGGLSGAAIVSRGTVIAVQCHHQSPLRRASLEATPISAVAHDQDFLAFIQGHGVKIDPHPVNVPNSPADEESGAARFATYVVSLYENMEYQLSAPGVSEQGHHDYIAERHVPGMGTARIFVRCIYVPSGVVSKEDIESAIVHFQMICDREQVSRCVLVTDGQFSSDSYLLTAGRPVSLQTKSSLESALLDLTDVFGRRTHLYENSELFGRYIDLHGVNPDGPDEREHMSGLFEQWVASEKPSVLWILGDFGAGKTTFVEHIRYEYAKRWLEDRDTLIPCLFRLRELHRCTLDEFIAVTTRREFGKSMPNDLFWSRLTSGRFLVLLDGFDEIASRSDRIGRIQNLASFSRLFMSPSPAIVSCRPAYFPSPAEFRDTLREIHRSNLTPAQSSHPSEVYHTVTHSAKIRRLRERLRQTMLEPSGSSKTLSKDTQVVELSALNSDDALQYLNGVKDQLLRVQRRSPREALDFLESVYDLTELMQRPLLLSMIVDTLLADAISVDDRDLSLGPSILYDTWTWMKFEIDWNRGSGRKEFLNREQRREAAQMVAVAMYDEGDALEISYNRLADLVSTDQHDMSMSLREALSRATIEEIVGDICTCGFLTWSENETFKFIHKSFKEFFVARHLKQTLISGRLDERLLRACPREILYFLGGFAVDDEQLAYILQSKSAESGGAQSNRNDVLRRNFVGALLYSAPQHEDLLLNGVSITEQDVRRTMFTDCTFEDVAVDDVSIRACHWTRSLLKRVRLRAAVVRSDGPESLRTTISECAVEIYAEDTVFEKIETSGCDLRLNASDVQLDDVRFSDSELGGEWISIRGEGIRFDSHTTVRNLRIVESVIEGCESRGCTFIDINVSASTKVAIILDETTLKHIRVKRAGIVSECDKCMIQHATLQDVEAEFDMQKCTLTECRFDNTQLVARLSDVRVTRCEFIDTRADLYADEVLISDSLFAGGSLSSAGHGTRFEGCEICDYDRLSASEVFFDRCVIRRCTIRVPSGQQVSAVGCVMLYGRLLIDGGRMEHELTVLGTEMTLASAKRLRHVLRGIVVIRDLREPVKRMHGAFYAISLEVANEWMAAASCTVRWVNNQPEPATEDEIELLVRLASESHELASQKSDERR